MKGEGVLPTTAASSVESLLQCFQTNKDGWMDGSTAFRSRWDIRYFLQDTKHHLKFCRIAEIENKI